MATIPAALQWPTLLKRDRLLSWSPRFMNEYSPPTIDGTIQVRNTNGGGLWSAAFGTVQLNGKDQVLAWQGFEVWAKGGLEPIDVPFCGYRLDRLNPAVPVTLLSSTGGWAARAVTGRVTVGNGAGDLVAGIHFSDYDALYGYRLYRIGAIVANISPGVFDIAFWPPARVAAADSHSLEIEHPRCVMRLAASDAMDLELDLHKRGTPSVSFIEAF